MLKPFWLTFSGMFTIKINLGEATTESVLNEIGSDVN